MDVPTARTRLPAEREAAGVDRRLAEAEFRPYIRVAPYCQYDNARTGNNEA